MTRRSHAASKRATERDPGRIWDERHFPFASTARVGVSAYAGDPRAPLVVLCHGMGETPESFVRFWPRLVSLPVHVIVPAGPYPFEVHTDNRRRVGHAWYLYDGRAEPFRTTLLAAGSWLVRCVVEAERERGLKPRARALVGYSQGSYFGYVTALRHPEFFSDLVAVAGRLKREFTREALASGGALRTLILHGEEDQSVSADAARSSEQALRAAGFAADLRFLPGGHGLRSDRDTAAANWLAGLWNLEPPG